MRPFLGGGHMIRAERERSTWNDLPFKFEAGTSAATEAVGLGAAVEYLAALGMQNVRAHERELTAYALERLPEVDGITLFGPRTSIAAAGSSRSRSRACTRTTSPSSATRGGLRARGPLLRPAPMRCSGWRDGARLLPRLQRPRRG